jgi:hypothetical protein
MTVDWTLVGLAACAAPFLTVAALGTWTMTTL